jgi:hypothetical protein
METMTGTLTNRRKNKRPDQLPPELVEYGFLRQNSTEAFTVFVPSRNTDSTRDLDLDACARIGEPVTLTVERDERSRRVVRSIEYGWPTRELCRHCDTALDQPLNKPLHGWRCQCGQSWCFDEPTPSAEEMKRRNALVTEMFALQAANSPAATIDPTWHDSPEKMNAAIRAALAVLVDYTSEGAYADLETIALAKRLTIILTGEGR